MLRPRPLVPLFLAGLVSLLLGTAAFAGEQALPPMEVDPDSGPPGTVITVSGEQCFLVVQLPSGPELGPAPVDVELVNPDGAVVASAEAVSNPQGGTWSVELTVPADSDPGVYTIRGTCGEGEFSEGRPYPDADFTVTAQSPTTSPTTPTGTTPATTGVTPRGGTLPDTGAGVAAWLLGGIAMALLATFSFRVLSRPAAR